MAVSPVLEDGDEAGNVPAQLADSMRLFNLSDVKLGIQVEEFLAAVIEQLLELLFGFFPQLFCFHYEQLSIIRRPGLFATQTYSER